MSESVIAAICLLGEKTVDNIVAKLSPAELGQVIKIVGRSPNCYPLGAYAALKDKRDLASRPPQVDTRPLKVPRKEQAVLPTQERPMSRLSHLRRPLLHVRTPRNGKPILRPRRCRHYGAGQYRG